MKLFTKLAAAAAVAAATISAPAMAGEKGFYATGSFGFNQANDIDVDVISGTDYTIEPDSGVALDLGVGYDFGDNFRLEATWDRMISNEGNRTDTGKYDNDTTVDSYLASLYYDFNTNSKWSPFVGLSIGSTTASFGGVTADEQASSFSYGVQAGVSYEASEEIDVFGKISYLRVNDLDYDTLYDINTGAWSAKLGARFRF